MLLPKNQRYGTFHNLMETRPGHGGYGDVTWNVGPHASPINEGRVVWADVARLQGMIPRKKLAESIDRYVNEATQCMARGDVLQVPKVVFEGMNAVLAPEHHGALVAAVKRGATRVPIVYQEGSPGVLGLGGIEPISPGRPDQDPGQKWRWNGRSWYTNASFGQTT